MQDFVEQTSGAASLESENVRLREEVVQLRVDLQNAMAMLRFLQGQRFASSSERHADASVNQPFLIPPTSEHESGQDSGGDEAVVKEHRRKKKRPTLPPEAAREVIYHDLGEDEKVCPEHRAPLEKSGEKISERVEWINPRVNIERHVCAVYSCPVCDKAVKEASPPPSPIPGSIATSSLLAQIATSKYADGLPLYRQEGILRRYGLELTRTTMANWMIRLSQILAPIYNLLCDHVLLGPVLYIDETTMQVLKVPGKKATSQSYFWVRVGGPEGQKAVAFHFGPGRGANVAKSLVSGFKGYVATDGYDAAYDKIEGMDGIIRVQCWMHVRRVFKKALKVLGKAGKGGVADQALNRIRALYMLERAAAEMTPDERRAHRQEKAKPLLDAFKAWLDEQEKLVPPKGVTGKAITYALVRWSYLVLYLEDGHLKMDNGPAENAIRPVAIGRKNYLFSDTTQGAEASAVIYSVIETAKAHGLDPRVYLQHVTEKLTVAQTLDDIETLLPWVKPPPPINSTG